MGFDARPKMVFGFRTGDVHIDDEGIGITIIDEARHSGNHIVGIDVNFLDFKRRKESEEIKNYRRVMKKFLGIKCHYLLAISCDTEGNCDSDSVTSQQFIQALKPEWSDEKCWKVMKKIMEAQGYDSTREKMEKRSAWEKKRGRVESECCVCIGFKDETDEEESKDSGDSEEEASSDISSESEDKTKTKEDGDKDEDGEEDSDEE